MRFVMRDVLCNVQDLKFTNKRENIVIVYRKYLILFRCL